MKTSSVDGEMSLISLMHSPSKFLALPPAPNLEQTQNNNPLHAYEGTKHNQYALLLPFAHPDIQQPLNYTDVGSLRQKLLSDNATVGSSSLGLEEPEVLQSVTVSSINFADILVRTQHQDLLEGEDTGGSEKVIENKESKVKKSVPKSPSDKTKRNRENNSKKTQVLKPSSNRVKAQDKPTSLKMVRNSPDISNDTLKKPPTHLDMHILEYVQVFHPLGKKNDKKTGISSLQLN
ncbi:LOW QUALITY PROTEIN: hypothetical protein U0070_000901 [Myodes glareolus]|uniref:DUF4629 domain-containing protein n=1 Tax=Myodes glareolus TaxID=447135 RepID=A0AAW0I0X9_MYOGA